jgi:hypothetical protein
MSVPAAAAVLVPLLAAGGEAAVASPAAAGSTFVLPGVPAAEASLRADFSEFIAGHVRSPIS